MADGVVIKITGDDSDFKKSMEDVGDTTEKEMKQAKKAVEPVENAYTSAGKKVEKFGHKMSGAGGDAKKAGDDAKDAGDNAEKAGKDAEKAGKKAKSSGDDAKQGGEGWEKFGTMAKSAGSLALKGVTAIGTGAAAITTAFLGTAESTRETRTAMAKLETGFVTSGFAAEDAANTYTGLYSVLGDADRATEASAHLAQLVDNEKDLQTWTNICTGVYATFGDSLPIEGLTEAANETAKTGAVTGVLADALNWAGVSEDEFNAKLAKCSSEQERQKLITKTLNGLYDKQANKFKELNANVIAANEAQNNLSTAIADVGAVAEPIMTTLKQLAADLLEKMLPFVELIGSGLKGVLDGTDGATKQLAKGIGGLLTTLLTKVTEALPRVSEIVIQIVQTLAQGLSEKADIIGETAVKVINTLVQGCIDVLPMLFDLALTLLVSLANGLAEQLPVLIPAIVDLVINICNTLLDNLPLILNAALDLMIGLANGLIAGVPVLVAYIPQIIQSLTKTLVEATPKLIECAITLMMALIQGLNTAIPTIIAALPAVVAAIIGGLINVDWVATGKSIIDGIIDGVVNSGKAMVDAIVNVAKQSLDAVKKFFGIASPSRVMRDTIGKQLPAGAAEGVEENADVFTKSMKKMGTSAIASAKKSLQAQNTEIAQPVLVSMLGNFNSSVHAPSHLLASTTQSMINRVDTERIAAAVKNGMEAAELNVDGRIETQVNLDGRKLADAQTPFVSKNVGNEVMKKRRCTT